MSPTEKSAWRRVEEAYATIMSGELTPDEVDELTYRVLSDPVLRNHIPAAATLLSQSPTRPRRQVDDAMTTLRPDEELLMKAKEKLRGDRLMRFSREERRNGSAVEIASMPYAIALQRAALEVLREEPKLAARYKNLPSVVDIEKLDFARQV